MACKLTPKQQRFVEEYLIDLNASQAAVRAGYKGDPDTVGPRLLVNVGVQAAIQEALHKRQKRTEVTADAVVRELAAMAFYDPAAIGEAQISGPADIKKLPEQVRRAIIGWAWDKHGNFTLKLSPKTPSLDLLARHLGMLTTKVELTGKEGGPVQHQQVPADLSGLTDDELDALERIASKLGGNSNGADPA
jgi:phage terminase small subunit